MQTASLIAAAVIALFVGIDWLKGLKGKSSDSTRVPIADLVADVKSLLAKIQSAKQVASTGDDSDTDELNPRYRTMRAELPSLDDKHALDGLRTKQMDAKEATQEPKP